MTDRPGRGEAPGSVNVRTPTAAAWTRARIDAVLTPGDGEVQEVANDDGIPQNVHVHELSAGSSTSAAGHRRLSWTAEKDTVFLRPGTSGDA